MKNSFLLLAVIGLASCASVKVSKQKNVADIKEIGIRTTYADKVPEKLRHRLDSVVEATATRFNSEHHTFSVTTNPYNGSDFITFNISKVKLVSKKALKTAYIINGIGMVALPITTVVAGASSPTFIDYLPRHKIRSEFTFSQDLAGTANASAHINTGAGVLFANLDKRTDHMLDKFSDKLYKELVDIQHQLGS